MFTTPRLVAIALCAALNFAIGNIVYLVKLPIYLDSIGTILCALLIFPDRLAAIACAFIAGFISVILSGLFLNPFLPWFSLTVLAIALVSALLTGLGTETFRARPLAPAAFAGIVVVCGIVTGIASAVVSAPVVVYLFGGVTGSGSAFVVAFFLKTGQQLLNSAILAGLTTEPIDKTLQVLLAALLYRATPREFVAMLAPGPIAGDMTPNGAVLFGLLVIAAALLARSPNGLGVLIVLVLVFALASGQRIWNALIWSAGIVAPLAAFMALVWIGIVGRAPQEIAADVAGSREAAALYVGIVCLRLLIIALTVQAAALHFAAWTPLRFVCALSAPAVVKKLVVLTLSLIETIMQAVDRARTALIAAGIITRRHSMRNLRHGWILVQTVWLTVVTIALGRTRDKWPIEGTLAHLGDTFVASSAKRPALADLGWLALATAGLTAAIGLR